MTGTPAPDVATDHFLGGRLQVRQPVQGYRAATDPVLLAAAVPVDGGSVLDLGCGVGTAALCLGARVSGLDLHGLEVQPAYAALARQNAELNGLRFIVHDGDLRAMPSALKERVFDGVMINPPWFRPEGSGSPSAARDIAHRLDTTLAVWLAAALSRLRPGGWLVLINRVEALPDIVGGLAERCGDIAVLPLASRAGRDAKRVLVKARKGSRGPFRLAPPFVVHEGTAHERDADDFTEAAQGVLRDGAPLRF